MQQKQVEPKSYSYHFTKIVHPYHPNHPTNFNDPLSPITSPKYISFRYHTEADSHQKSPLHFKKEALKTHPAPDKTMEPTKKYTFSLLASEARQQRALENQNLPLFSPDIHQKEAFTSTLPERQITETLRERSASKKPVKLVSQLRPERSLIQELKRQSELRRGVEKELAQLKARNEALEKKQKQLQLKIAQKEKMIAGTKIGEYPRTKQLQLCGNVCVLQLQEEPSFEKQNKEWSTSTISCTFEEEYKQILAIFEVQSNQEGFHQRLLTQIDRLFKKADELHKWTATCREKQKENTRLVHHLRRLQGENMHLAHLTSVIGKEHDTANCMLQQSNREIERLSFQKLNRKYQQVLLINE